jgi:GNAT superfamily N-acetyltransferase
LSKDSDVRPYVDGDEKELVKLLQFVFRGWPHLNLDCTDLEHWTWKYRDNPHEPSVIVVACEDDRIVGVNHSMAMKIKIGEGLCDSSYAADTAVHPDSRSRGVSKRLIEAGIEIRKEKGIKFTYFITRNPLLIKMNLKYYPLFPHPIANMVRIRDIDLHLRAIPVDNATLMKAGFQGLRLINQLANLARSRPPTSGLNVSEVKIFDDRVDEFWERVSDQYDFIVERRGEYLNWRYCDPRVGDNVIKMAEEDGKTIGYSVLRVNSYRQEYPIGYIVDLIALPGRLDAVHILAEDAVRFFDDRKVNIVNYQLVKGHPYESIMKSYGFLDSRVKIHVFYLVTGIDEEIRRLESAPAGRVHFSYGDIDSLPTGLLDYQ